MHANRIANIVASVIRHRALRDGVTRAVAFLSVCLLSVCLRRFVLYCAYTMAFSSGIFVCIPLVYLLAFCLSCMPVGVSACLTLVWLCLCLSANICTDIPVVFCTVLIYVLLISVLIVSVQLLLVNGTQWC